MAERGFTRHPPAPLSLHQPLAQIPACAVVRVKRREVHLPIRALARLYTLERVHVVVDPGVVGQELLERGVGAQTNDRELQHGTPRAPAVEPVW